MCIFSHFYYLNPLHVEIGQKIDGTDRLVAAAGVEPTYSFGEGASILGEIEVAPNVTTCRYVQNEVFLSVIVSKVLAESRPVFRVPRFTAVWFVDERRGSIIAAEQLWFAQPVENHRSAARVRDRQSAGCLCCQVGDRRPIA
jgi:hypothetical protein